MLRLAAVRERLSVSLTDPLALDREVEGNRLAAIAWWLVIICITRGIFFTLEHPLPSRFWRLPLVLFILALAGIYFIELDQ